MRPHKLLMWLIPIGMFTFLGFNGYQIYEETTPVPVAPIHVQTMAWNGSPVAPMSDGDAVIMQSHWSSFQDEYRILSSLPGMFVLFMPLIMLVWFFFTPLYEVVCYKMMGFLVVQPPLDNPLAVYPHMMHDFGYRGLKDNLKTDSYKMSHHQFMGSNNCNGCGANGWSGDKCVFCGGARC